MSGLWLFLNASIISLSFFLPLILLYNVLIQSKAVTLYCVKILLFSLKKNNNSSSEEQWSMLFIISFVKTFDGLFLYTGKVLIVLTSCFAWLYVSFLLKQ